MSPRRGERVAPPAGPEDYDIRYDNNDAARGWEELCRLFPENTLDAWNEMRANPGPKPPTTRHHQLKYDLATVQRGSDVLPQWQIEVTGKARVWYVLDSDRKTCWLRWAGTGHPKATD